MNTTDIKSAVFGNVTFGENGISYEVPYKEPNWDEVPHSNFKVLACVKTLVEGRLQACIKHLNENIINNIGSSKEGFIYFKDGSHFSRRAAEAMQQILNCDNLGKFDSMMLNQAIKACINPKIVVDGHILISSNTEKELQLTIDVLMEYQIMYNDTYTQAMHHGLISEFEEALKNGYTIEKIRKEWDL